MLNLYVPIHSSTNSLAEEDKTLSRHSSKACNNYQACMFWTKLSVGNSKRVTSELKLNLSVPWYYSFFVLLTVKIFLYFTLLYFTAPAGYYRLGPRMNTSLCFILHCDRFIRYIFPPAFFSIKTKLIIISILNTHLRQI